MYWCTKKFARIVLTVAGTLFLSAYNAQCPLLNDYPSGTATSSPMFVSCTGGAFTLNLSSPSSFGSYTVNWGDASPNTTGGSYTANSFITHVYAAGTVTHALTLLTSTCTITGTVVQEQAALASIVVPSGVGSTLCAPKTLTFTNGTTFTSATTSYTWNFGDTPNVPAVFGYTNAGQDVTHLYQKGSVNCVTTVSLMAKNYCNFSPSIASFGPLQVYDIDNASVTPDKVLRCWPDNQFTFTNGTSRNCFSQGNNSQRVIKWNFGNYWGFGHDSIVGWDPWPSSPRSVAFPSIGSYNIMLIDSSLCGIDTAFTTVLIVTSPTAGVSAPSPICLNSSATFSNTSQPGVSYRWNFGDGGGFTNLGAGNKTHTYTVGGPYTVSLVALIPGGGNACSDTARTAINVQPLPSAGFSLSPSTACGSVSVTFTNQSSLATAWNWTFGNGSTSTLQTPAAESYTTPNAYTVTQVAVSASGCTSTATRTLLVRNVPVPSFSPVTGCSGSAVTFTNTSSVTGTNAINAYTWNFGDGSAATTATNPTHVFVTPGTFTVRLKVTTGFCTDSADVPMLVNISPTASFVATPTLACPPFTATFANMSQNGSQYHWRFASAASATSAATGGNFTYSNTTQSTITETVTLVATNTLGCVDSVKKTIMVYPRPVASFTVASLSGCSPLSTTFSNTTVGGSSYAWDFGDGGTSSSASPAHSFSNSTLFTATHTVQLIATNSVGCTDTSRANITVYAEALTNFTMTPSAGCTPLVVNFPSVPGVATYTWTHGDGSPQFTTSALHSWTYTNNGTAPQVFTVTLTAKTSNSCVGTGSSTLTVYHKPTASFVASQTVGCSPMPVTFTSTSLGASSLFWRLNGVTSTVNIPSATFTNAPGGPATTFTTSLVALNAFGCKDSTAQQVSLYPRPLAAFAPDTPACTPKTMKLKNVSSGATSFSWNFGDGGSSSADSAIHVYVNHDQIRKIYLTKLVAVNGNGCKDSVTVPVGIFPKPVFAISALPDSGCTPLKVRFPTIPGVSTYEWRYDNIAFGSSGDISNIFVNPQTTVKVFTITMAGKDANGCGDTATRTVKVYPKPVARFSARPMTAYLPDAAVTFVNESSSNAATFSWSFGDGDASKEKNPVHTYAKTGEYTALLVASTSRGCRDTFELPDKIVVIEQSAVQVPNAFSPNPAGSPGRIYDPLDLSNDIFHPNVNGAEKFSFSIYSRWGELLFDTKDPREGWDGYYRGKLCVADVYVWKLDVTFVDGSNVKKTGEVLLLR